MNNEERLTVFLGIVEKTTSALITATTELERLEPTNGLLNELKETIKTNLYFQDEFSKLF